VSVVLFWINTVIAALFWMEAWCKIVAFGVAYYFDSNLNRLE
jgi:hypothetical protein